MKTLQAPFRRRSEHRNGADGTIWALKDVSFEVMPGEVLGIIGANGAGKSTLLNVLSRIIAPTSGRVELYGRVASLLEVGTGFHPDLTGRENVYLNGAVLGMKRREIEERFDEIIAFAEVDKFIDTAVKRYSSGMYIRLAFSVAAHLNPEILIVDEVLAVGDAHFQKKCLGKMDDFSRSGRTVLFVSHSMNLVTQLCERAILLKDGAVAFSGPTNEVVDYYNSTLD
jgi:lipopolysaccharide transport system ATP-binding protein